MIDPRAVQRYGPRVLRGIALELAGSGKKGLQHKGLSLTRRFSFGTLTNRNALQERNPHLYQRDIEKIVGTIFDEITEALARGDRVELRGFGAFSIKRRDARTGRNPRTGEAVTVTEKYIPFFKTGKQLRERINVD